VHSVESFTAVDGHGIRAVIFLQGCNKRCVFCCNPDSWSPSSGRTMTVEQVFKPLLPKLGYYRSSGGGITISGGEPLLQPKFCKALCDRARQLGLTAAIDTAADGFEAQWRDLLPSVSLALVCVKSADPQRHRLITGSHDARPHRTLLKFLKCCEQMEVPVWLRYVLMAAEDREEGSRDDVEKRSSDDASDLKTKKKPRRRKDFRDFSTVIDSEILSVAALAKAHANVEGIELLPYHTFGAYKWREMGLEYPLSGMKPPSPETVTRVKRLLERENVRVVV
jgi:pyruvate-formate lyase-activating enzyme